MSDTPARLLNLLSLLQAQREWPGAKLAERLGVSPRTIRRDIERLRDLGYTVQATRGSIGGYRLSSGRATPPLLLGDDEAIAIAIGLCTAASGGITGMEEASLAALVKLEQLLPSRLRYRVTALHAATVALRGSFPAPTVDPKILSVIAGACRDHECLRFAYCGRDGGETKRLTEPNRLVSAGRRWYLVAWDVGREDWRTFRVDRIQAPLPVGVRFTQRELPTKDAAAYVARALASWRPQYEAVIILYAPIQVAADRIRPSDGTLEPMDEHSCRLHLSAENLDWLTIHVGMLGIDFDIVHPPELADHVRAIGHRLIRGADGR